jgi:hypothetical protein
VYITGPGTWTGGMKGGMLVGVNPNLSINTNPHAVKGRPQQSMMKGPPEQQKLGKYRDFMKKQKDQKK